MNSIGIIARKEFQSAFRNRLFITIAVLFLVPGLALVVLGRLLRRKAREIRVRRDLGDRW